MQTNTISKPKVRKRYALEIKPTCCGDYVIDRRGKMLELSPLSAFIAACTDPQLRLRLKYAWETHFEDEAHEGSPLALWLEEMRGE